MELQYFGFIWLYIVKWDIEDRKLKIFKLKDVK